MTRHLAIRLLGLLLLALAPVGCFESAAPNCAVSCVVDADCPSDLMCSSDGKCSTDGEVCVPIVNSCTAGEFLTCVGTQTQVCNQNGDGADLTECGAPGCNAAAGRCNTCAPSELTCGAGDVLQACSADGTGLTDVEMCSIGCEPGDGNAVARCRTLAPVWLPAACEMPAVDASLAITSSQTLDTSADVICNGGILDQQVGRQICLIRYGTISIASGATLAISGIRVAALVADGALQINGVLDVSANGLVGGPGAGFNISGTRPIGPHGGGGAGFRTVGGNGGDGDGSGAGVGGTGGAVFNPLAANNISGGPRTENIPIQAQDSTAYSGGPGGAAVVVSCKSTVRVAGTIDAGGGGGRGGFDSNILANMTILGGGGGGGAGGYVVLQGAQVELTSSAQLYANGGGGGGGNSLDGATGQSGSDAARSTTNRGIGGSGTGVGGRGGDGGIGTSPPTAGISGGSAGGGGGAVGRFQIYTPTGVTPLVDAAVTFSPPRDADLVVPTR